MRTAPFAALALMSLAVTACGKSDSNAVKLENASLAEVAEATKAGGGADEFQPGQWKTTTEIVSIDMPGMPKEVADQMGKSIAQASASEHCMTPEEAKKPSEALARDNGECRFETFSMSGGKLDAKMRCQPAGQPGTMEMAMAGTYKPDRYEATADMKISQPGAQGKEMTMKIKTVSERIGDCKA